MSRIRPLPAVHRVVAVLAPAVLTLVFAFLLLRGVADLRLQTRAVERTYEVIHTLGELRARVLEAETSTRGYLLTGDSSFLAEQAEGIADARRDFDTLRRLTAETGTHPAELTDLALLLEERLARVGRITLDRAAAVGPELDGSREAMARLSSALGALEERELSLLAEQRAAAEGRLRRTGILVAVAGAAALLVLLTNLLITRYMVARARSEDRIAEANARLREQTDELAAANFRLSQSENRFRRISDSNMVGVLFWTTDGAVSYANDRVLEMIGYTRSDLERGKIDWRRLTPPEWREADQMALREIAEAGVTRPFEKEYIRSDGTRIPVLLSAAAFEDDPTRGVTLVIDLSVQKAVLGELDEARGHMRMALDSAGLGTWDLDLATGLTYWDERTREVLGVPDEGLISMDSAVARIHPDDRAASIATFERTLLRDTDDIYKMEKRIVRPDGSIRWGIWTGMIRRGNDGEPLRVVGTLEDVTEVREARDRLRESDARFRLTTEALPQIVWTARADGVVDFYNDRWRQFSGVSPELDYSEGWRPVVHPDDRAVTDEAWRHALDVGDPLEIEHRVARADGEFRWLLSRAVPLRQEGRVIRWFGTATDIHERKLSENELRTARDAAEAASRARSQFLAVMSHELRTPLTAVIGFADLLETGVLGQLSERQRLPLKRISACAWGLVQIINDILTFSRAEAGREPLNREEFELVELVQSVADLMEPEATRRGLLLTVGERPPLMLESDAGKIRQIMINLLGNALKFTDRGEVRVDIREAEGELEVVVTDTGRGIPADQIELVFEPFTQADQSNTRDKGGTGLGLTVSRRLARLLGGDVIAESNLGVGSSFTLRLPLEASVDRPDFLLQGAADS